MPAKLEGSILDQLPEELIAELRSMRRNPTEFTGTTANCKFCDKKVVKDNAVALSHSAVREAGVWCPVHGWLYFQSTQLPPQGDAK